MPAAHVDLILALATGTDAAEKAARSARRSDEEDPDATAFDAEEQEDRGPDAPGEDKAAEADDEA
ncbi:unnamed protein product [Durusdinium trenchii]|uniref:Uncharacterized protein n=1 Tax=Durusdinium trenchii TaxID=1381693 RepID=A0ABP0M3Y0_9DINO